MTTRTDRTPNQTADTTQERPAVHQGPTHLFDPELSPNAATAAVRTNH